MGDPSPATLLKVSDLVVEFKTAQGVVRAVNEVSFSIRAGETLGVVGESGCGKSVTALSLMQLVPSPPGTIANGLVHYEGRELLALRPSEMRKLRGNKISMIFQEPMTSLNPVLKVGEQVAEAVRLHHGASRAKARQEAIDMFTLVGIPSPAERVHSYPHQMSGGMRQRVMIAIALACKPGLLIADEPTTALDVTIQAQILELLRDLQNRLGMSILLITHDLAVVAESCHDVIVMYAGRIVEQSSTVNLFDNPRHPYTVGLLGSMPGSPQADSSNGRLQEIPGTVPPLYDLPEGCAFQNRCSFTSEICRRQEPELLTLGAGKVRCHHALPEHSS